MAHGIKVMKLKWLLALELFFFGRLETAEEAGTKLLTTWQKKDSKFLMRLEIFLHMTLKRGKMHEVR